ncbi:unnamed protein product [Effrenium voratum]|nr:unnamed protein product [Effrenium voratum]
MTKIAAVGPAVVVTHGAEGAFWAAQGAFGAVPPSPLPAATATDSTGAGDACSAALVASWASGEDLASAVAKGCAAGTLNCARSGGCDVPVTWAEIMAHVDGEKKRTSGGPHRALAEDELWQAMQFASYPRRITGVQIVVYANKPHRNLDLLQRHAPFPVKILRQEGEWKGTLDKLIGYWTYLKTVSDDDVVVFLDAFDVFPNGLDGHELLRRFFSFGTPVVIAAEENVFPREVLEQAKMAVEQMDAVGLGNASAPSRFLNAGGIIGMGWALRKMYDDVRDNMAANNPQMLMAHADIVGHWFLHSYDQYELWRYFIRHVRSVEEGQEERMVALDTEQLIFGSTVYQKANWPVLLNNTEPGIATREGKGHSIDVDVPLVFDAPQSVFETYGCSGRFLGRAFFPVFWHGHGPWKAAWEGLRNRLQSAGCLADGMPRVQWFTKKMLADSPPACGLLDAFV